MRILPAAILALSAIAAAMPTEAQSTVLRRKDVQALHVAVSADSPLTLTLSGVAANSGSVESIGTRIDGDSLYVLVALGPPKPRLAGTFEFTVVVPEGVDRIRFGPDGELVWQR